MSSQNSSRAESKTSDSTGVKSILNLLRSLGGSPKAPQDQFSADYQLLSKTPLFDASWYLDTYDDVKKAGVDPIKHYLTSGASEGRLANRLFDSAWYLNHYPDVAESRQNPLIHYIRFGASEGRSPHPAFIN